MRALAGWEPGGENIIEVTSWLGGVGLASLPVVEHSWKVTDEADVEVPGTLEMSVPNIPAMRATHPEHPLARFGQELRVRLNAGGTWLNLGRYRLTGTTPTGDVIQVRGQGRLRNLERSQLLTSLETGWGDTRTQVLQRIVGGVLPVWVSAPDTLCPPRTFEPRTTRLDALHELVETWPARAYVDDLGVLCVVPPWQDTQPLYTLDAFEAVAPVPDDRDPYNAFVVTSRPEGGDAPLTVSWGIPEGPLRFGGPYGENPGFYESPLLGVDRDHLEEVARLMALRQTRLARSIDYTMPLDPRQQVGDRVHVVAPAEGVDGPGRIVSIAHTQSRTSGRVALA